MEIKVSTTSAKAAKVTIGLDVKSAEVLKEFLVMAVGQPGLTDDVSVALDEVLESEVSACDVSEIICGIINGLDGE